MPAKVAVIEFAATGSPAVGQAVATARELFRQHGLYLSFARRMCRAICKPAAGTCHEHDDLAAVRGCPSGKSKDWDQSLNWAQSGAKGYGAWLLVCDIQSSEGGCGYPARPMAVADVEYVGNPGHALVIAHELGHVFGLSDEPYAITVGEQSGDPLTFMENTGYSARFISPAQRAIMLANFPALGHKP